MKIPSEVQCKTCSQVFCCAKCRQKHEDNSHQEMKAIRQICYICNNRPFPLRTDTKVTAGNVLVEHILREHLPLRCNRCTKVFHTAADFKSIARCLNPNYSKDPGGVANVCHLEHNPNIPTILETAAESPSAQSLSEENKENVDKNNSTSSSDRSSQAGVVMGPPTAIKVKATTALAETPQPISKELRAITDPIESIDEVNEAMLTPLSMINLRWKRKSRQSFDSILSTTNNISAVNASEGAVMLPPSPSKKLVRSTSTPMMHGCLPQHLKGVNESYASAIGQMSSIHSNSGSESDSRAHDTPNSPTNYEINKVRAIIRSRSKVAATPLRQVMSKSIQRAIAQHGYARMLAPGTQRKMSFSSTGSISGMSSTNGSPSRMALDLRTTPVLKRTASEGSTGSRTAKVIRLDQKSQSEDLSGQTLEEASNLVYYDTHQNAESLNSTVDQENHDNHKLALESFAFVEPAKPIQPVPSCYNETPKIAGGILKKVISFTPETTRHPPDDPDETNDIWATPCAIPTRSYSCSALKDLGSNSLMTEVNSDSSDDIFPTPIARSKSCKQLKLDSPVATVSTGKLWTIVSNVIRLASRNDIREELTTGSENSSGSDSDTKFSATALAKKAASFAGFLRNRLPGVGPPIRYSSSGSDEFSPQPSGSGGTKRRRTASIYARPYETIGKVTPVVRTSSSPLAKRKRIQGRQPIERMRTNSSRSGSGSDF